MQLGSALPVGDFRLGEIASFREVRFFNGQLLVFKTGFRLTAPGRSRLGVAVGNSYAELLRSQLR
jgi:hypothetical protein